MSFLGELKRRNVIRVAIGYLAGAWLLIQILETLFPIFGLAETSIRVVVIALAIGFVPVLIATWVFELTPEGWVRDSGGAGAADQLSHKRFDRIVVAMLLIAVAVFATHTFILDPARDAAERDAAREEGRTEGIRGAFGDKSIAVLPFTNMSSDPEQEFFGDGIAEELLNLLARVDGLRVISRTSAFSFKGSDDTIIEIAEQLDVAYILEGSVRKSENALRITAQLIDARADAHVWSETFDRSIEDIFIIQDEVAATVVEQLQIELDVATPTVTRHDPVAYALFLQARLKLISAAPDLDVIEDLLGQALKIDPGYSDAKVWLAWVYEYRSRAAERLSDDALATQHLDRKVAILEEVAAHDADNVFLNVTMGWENMRNIEVAPTYLERALAGEPTNSEALNGAAVLLTRLWREEEAVAILRYTAERDPLNIHVTWNLSRAYLNNRQFDRAQQATRKYSALTPDALHPPWIIGLSQLLQAKPEAALQQFVEQVSDAALQLHGRTLALYDLGRIDEANAALAELIELQVVSDSQWIRPFLVATAFAWTGNLDDAFTYLEMQRELNSSIFRVLANSPLYENLNDDSRWAPFLESVELAPERLAAIEFNPRLPPGVHAQKAFLSQE
jgi:TolB-like protein/Flp pilus assembly protein TadD